MSGGKVCFNRKCGTTSSAEWRSGWPLRSGQFADLCDSCGSAFEQMRFCEIFHSDDTGWRTCKMCKKLVHCGCISSVNLFMCLDGGGIECILCARKSGGHIAAYFPSNSQSEGVALKIEDANIKDRLFQFSFLPSNNNSMHVLERVTPCMQSVQLQAGNTVNFSQLELEEKTIMGFRKASNSNAQEPPIFGTRTTSHTKRSRALSSAPCKVSFGDLDKLPERSIGTKRKNVSDIHTDPVNSCGLDASANAVTLGEKTTASSLVSSTTKHPRHRLGCTCIVCIQPPSGMGPKHKPSCTCNVCITVKRRFKTLMLRRRKEAENARKKHNSLNEQKDVNNDERKEFDVHPDFENEFLWETPAPVCKNGITKSHDYPGNEVKLASNLNLHASCKDKEGVKEDCLVSKGQIDLNSQPGREEEELLEISRERTMGVLDNVALPLDMCIKQYELPTLIYPPQISNTLGFQQSLSEEIVEETSRVQNEDHIMKEEFISNRTENDAKSTSI